MKKEDLFTLIVYAMMVAIAIFVGVNIIAPAFVILGITGVSQYVYATITIFFAFLINVVLLELGHILGALAGGYRIQTVNVLGLALIFSHPQSFVNGHPWSRHRSSCQRFPTPPGGSVSEHPQTPSAHDPNRSPSHPGASQSP